MSSTTIIKFIIAVGLAVLVQATAFSCKPDPAASQHHQSLWQLAGHDEAGKAAWLEGTLSRSSLPCWPKPTISPRCRRIAVGSSWSTLTPQQQAGITNAFTRMTIATYASRFDGFSGEQFQILETIDRPNGDKIVKTQIVKSDGGTVPLNYLMRKSGSDWKVVDVYLDGTISELGKSPSRVRSDPEIGGARRSGRLAYETGRQIVDGELIRASNEQSCIARHRRTGRQERGLDMERGAARASKTPILDQSR